MRAAPTSPRSGRRPRRRSATPGWLRTPPTATRSARSTRPATSAPTRHCRGHDPRPPRHTARAGRCVGVQRGCWGDRGRRLGQRQPGHPGGRRHLVGAGPVRRCVELQRLDRPGEGGGLSVAGPDRCDDALGLDPADRQPERLADDPAEADRCLLPERQQRHRAAAAFGGWDVRWSDLVRGRSDGQSAQHLDPRGPDLRRDHPAAVRQRHPGGHPGDHGHHPGHQQPAVDRRQPALRRVLHRADRRGPGL